MRPCKQQKSLDHTCLTSLLVQEDSLLVFLHISRVQFSSLQSLSHVRLFETSWTAACQAFLSITNSWSILKIMSIESVRPSNHLILYHPCVPLPSVFPSISVFQLVRYPCCPRDSQESSPAPQFESISSALSPFYGPALKSVFEYLLVEF